MNRLRAPKTRVQQAGRSRAREQTSDLLRSIESLRLDYGYSARRLAAAAGISHGTYSEIQSGTKTPSIEVLARLSAALGGRLNLYLQQGTGPAVRDHLQAAMLQATFARLHERWRRAIEVNVYRPVRGVIDAVLDDPFAALAVATEAHSDLRRIEQQVRWANAKADALALARGDERGPVTVSRLLLLRSTATTRQVAAMHADLLAAAYPARHEDALASLVGAAPWPGAAIVWCTVEKQGARFLDRAPYGIRG
jgi:transcriptional regulator with XRE-family HTH domain